MFQSIAAAAILAVVAGGALLYHPWHPADNPAPGQQTADQSNSQISQGQITITVDGQKYGTFPATQSDVILNHFMTKGDTLTVTCNSLPQGASSVTIMVGTNIRIYEITLQHAGDQQTWEVKNIPAGSRDSRISAQDDGMKWFANMAQQGNAIAEYGMGNMYDAGLNGLAADDAQALMWFQRAANQNYADAGKRVDRLQQPAQPPQAPQGTK